MNNDKLSENEIRPENCAPKGSRLYEEDVKTLLLSRKSEFVEVECPACEKSEYKKWGKKNLFQFVICVNCETVYINPRPTPKILDNYYKKAKYYEFWNEYIFPASENARREKIFKPRAELLRDLCEEYNIKNNILIDVGAGFGTFCEEAQKLNIFKRVIAVEPGPGLAETCRKKRLEVIEKRIEKVVLDDSTDVITNFEVIEHLFCPREFLLACASILLPGGIIITTTPNIKGFDISLLKEISDIIEILSPRLRARGRSGEEDVLNCE